MDSKPHFCPTKNSAIFLFILDMPVKKKRKRFAKKIKGIIGKKTSFSLSICVLEKLEKVNFTEFPNKI